MSDYRRNAEQLSRHRAWMADYRSRNRDWINEKQKAYSERPGISDKRRAYYRNNPIRNLLYEAKKRARAKGLQFDLTPDLFVLPAVCPVLGIPIILNGPRDNWPSIDRISNDRGYVIGNVCIISYRANKLKNDASVEELKMVIRYMQEKILNG